MDLRWYVLLRMALTALVCLLASGAYVLYDSHRQARQINQQTAAILVGQLQFQLLRMESGLGQANPFPDFEIWKQTASQPGVCIRYRAVDDGRERSLCTGGKLTSVAIPGGFAWLYRQLFEPGRVVTQAIEHGARMLGNLTVEPSAEGEIEQAWQTLSHSTVLSLTTILAVCLMTYLNLYRALQPAQLIVAGINQLESGRLDHRLPTFALREWQRIAAAINHLAANQQQLLAERQALIVKLMSLQEDERRMLVRELHDEWGQCLAAINAVASGIRQTAAAQCPLLVDDAEHISRITGHMLQSLRGLLGQLRPAEWDELGLQASLSSLVAGWNARSGNTRFQLQLVGVCGELPEAQAIALFRIAQEDLAKSRVMLEDVEKLYVALCGPSPQPLKKLLVDRLIVSWLHFHWACRERVRARNLGIGHRKFLEHQVDRAEKRYRAATKDLHTLGKEMSDDERRNELLTRFERFNPRKV